MPELELFKLRPLLKRGTGAPTHLHLKGHTQKRRVLANTLKAAILSYKKLSAGYFELKLHVYTQRLIHSGTSETYFTSFKKGHNRSPLSFETCRMF